jgi:hypothetical protein
MDLAFRDQFLELWRRYFGKAELPVVFYFSDNEGGAERMKPTSGHQCVIGVLSKARKGHSISFERDSVGCVGGRKYLGFTHEIMPKFEYFLSCGIRGELEGERYKKTPELVQETVKNWPLFEAPAKFVVFKRWDRLTESDEAEVVIFFGEPDVLSGLFTLANFDEVEPNGVFCAFRRRLRNYRPVSLPRKELRPSQRRPRDVRCLREALRPPSFPHLRRAHGKVLLDGGQYGGEFPHHLLLGQGEEANRMNAF